MSLTTLTTLTLFALAAGLGWMLGGASGTGVFAGFLAGACVAGVSLAVQRKIARDHPRYVLQSVLGGFLFKACLMLVLTLTVHYVDALAAVCSAFTFLLAFAATTLAILVPGTHELLTCSGAKFASATVKSREAGAL